jgi:hypothetical protein
MKKVLVTISGGIIDKAIFFDDVSMAIRALSKHAKAMNIENDDAAVYGPDGLIANAKDFLDEHDRFIENAQICTLEADKKTKPIYIIGNPKHWLGFMVASPDDPLGYKKPEEALSDLGQMRKDSGNHLKLYKVVPVAGPIVNRQDLENHNADCEVQDFDYSRVEEYLD